jgi:Gp37 protein
MNGLSDFKQAMIRKLQAHFGNRLKIEDYPDNPENYLLTHVDGAILVQYQSSSYNEITSTSLTREPRFFLVFVLRKLNGLEPIEKLIDETDLLFHDWWPPQEFGDLVTAGGPAGPAGSRFLFYSPSKGQWYYESIIKIRNIPFPIQ